MQLIELNFLRMIEHLLEGDITGLTWSQLGLLAGGAATVFKVFDKVIDYLIYVTKKAFSKEEAVKESQEAKAAKLAEKALIVAEEGVSLSKRNGEALGSMQRDIEKISMVLIEGNGQPAVTTRLAVVESQLKDHVSDPNVHKNPSSERKR